MSQPMLPTSVDINQLEQAVVWLEQLQEFVETQCLGHMSNISAALNSATNIDMSDVDYKLTKQATVFGGFYSGYGMQAKHDGNYRAVQESLRGIAEHLGKAANATKVLIENYRTVEERNAAMAADIQRVLDQARYTPNNLDGTGSMSGSHGASGSW